MRFSDKWDAHVTEGGEGKQINLGDWVSGSEATKWGSYIARPAIRRVVTGMASRSGLSSALLPGFPSLSSVFAVEIKLQFPTTSAIFIFMGFVLLQPCQLCSQLQVRAKCRTCTKTNKNKKIVGGEIVFSTLNG